MIGSRVQGPIDKMAKVDLFQSLQQVAKGGKVGSLNKPIKKNNQESNSDGDPWLERPGSGCCSTTGISGERKGHTSCCRALPHPLLALTLQVIPYTCPTCSIF